MYFVGCDVGARTAKVVVLKEDRLMASAVVKSGLSPAESGWEALTLSLERSGLSMGDIDFIMGTGCRTESIPFVHEIESEISCHARRAYRNMPSCRTIIDIGGQYVKIIKIDDNGRVEKYLYSDKCAIGIGCILEDVAEALNVEVSELGDLSEKSTKGLRLPMRHNIYAQNQVEALKRDGKEIPDIVHAFHKSLAVRVAGLAKRMGIEAEIVITGGVAKNCGLFMTLAEAMETPLQTLYNADPQMNGAVGAALAGRDIYLRGMHAA